MHLDIFSLVGFLSKSKAHRPVVDSFKGWSAISFPRLKLMWVIEEKSNNQDFIRMDQRGYIVTTLKVGDMSPLAMHASIIKHVKMAKDALQNKAG